MFNYPDTKRAPIKSVAQLCLYCNRWFDLSAAEIANLHKNWTALVPDSAIGVPFSMCNCRHCGKQQIAILPGKYDRPNMPRKRCTVQHVVLDLGGRKGKCPWCRKAMEVGDEDPVRERICDRCAKKSWGALAKLNPAFFEKFMKARGL